MNRYAAHRLTMATSFCLTARSQILLFAFMLLTNVMIHPTAAAADTQASAQPVLAARNQSLLNAQETQVLFVDLQPELIRDSRTVKASSLSANAAVLAQVAKLTHVPVAFSIVPVKGQPGHHLPALADYATANNTVQRVMAGTFMEPRLVSLLASRQRKTLIVAGYATEVAVLQTALGALKAGYTVYVVTDVCGSRSARTEEAALRQMEMAGAIPASVLAIAAQLAPDFSQQPGSEVLATFDSLSPP